MARIPVQRRALEKARTIVGGLDKLAAAFRLPAGELQRLLDGAEEIPSWVFLRAVDVINEFEEELYREISPATDSASVHRIRKAAQ